jgi:general secretion pathway protein D
MEKTMRHDKTANERETDPASELRWLEIAAGIACLIGVVGILALLSQSSWAADANPAAKGGFAPGSKTFTNPFANTNKAPSDGNNNFFEDEDEDDGGQPQSATAGGVAPTAGTVNPNGTISGGGTTPGGVIEHNTEPLIKVDSETGEGSKEIVTDFNFPDADILDIAKTLGKLSGKNFILDKDVKGRITIISNSPITVGDAWRSFLTALDINGFAIIPSGKFLRIARQRDARDKQLKTYVGDYSPDTDALITRVFPLKYINAEEVARTFRSFMPANSRIIGYEQTNTVIVTDTGSNIAKLAKMLEILDIEGYDAGIEVIPVKYASAAELSKLIDQLLPGTGTSPTGGAPRFGATGSKFNARRTKEGGIINTIISDDRTNTLIVHANTKGADQVRELVSKLDQKIPSSQGGGKVHVVYLQFADAEAIATTLNNLTSGAGTPGGFRPVTPGGAGTGTGTNPVAASLFEGSIKVAPDKSTNALVVTASPADFTTVQRVINRLDIPRDEVYVELVIMEVALNKQFNYSANLINPASGIALTPNQDLYNFITNPTQVAGASLGFIAGGTQNFTVGSTTVPVHNLQGLINLLQSNTKSNVLATPQIIALDNTEADFESTESVPIPQTNAVQGAGTQQSITYKPVPLSIKLTPQINKMSNFVKLKIETKLSSIQAGSQFVPSALASQAFATLDRVATTTVVVADSDTVVLGGLIRDEITETVNKIPVLGDIPVLGWLFKSKNSGDQKSNLLLFITPHIVRQYEAIRAILDKKLKSRDEFIETNQGGDDPLRGTRDDIIRSLPDLKELLGRKPQTSINIDEDKDTTGATQNGNPFTGGGDANAPTTPGTAPAVPVVPQSENRSGAELAPQIQVPPPAPPLPEGGAPQTIAPPTELPPAAPPVPVPNPGGV